MPTNTSNPYKPSHKAAPPRRVVFDPWNTASKGHQHAENRLSGSTSWRTSRTLKINEQFTSGVGGGGGRRIADTVGAGSTHFGEDGRTDTGWDDSVKGWRGRQGLAGQGWGDIAEMMTGDDQTKKRKRDVGRLQYTADEEYDDMPPPSAQQPRIEVESEPEEEENGSVDTSLVNRTASHHRSTSTTVQDPTSSTKTTTSKPSTAQQTPAAKLPPQIFASLTIHINGTTYPTISDHKLKYLLTSHGAHLALSHARRQVTHVITGRTCSSTASSATCASAVSAVSAGKTIPTAAAPILLAVPAVPRVPTSVPAGGGLAASKIAKEISQKHGAGHGLSKGVRYVSVEWVMESVKAGVRLSEARFPGVNVAPRGVRSVRDMFFKV